jgi:hypothetical protein
MKLNSLQFLAIFTLIGCNNNFIHKVEKPVVKSDRAITTEITEISVESNIQEYHLYEVFEAKDDLYLALYDKSTFTLEVMHLNSFDVLFQVKLNEIIRDINKHGSVNSIEVVSFDSIFILQNNALSLIDTATLKYAIEINRDTIPGFSDNMLMNMDHAPIYYDPTTNSISTQSYCYTCYFYDQSYYEAPIHVSYSLDSHRFSPLPIYYQEKYKRYYFGFHNLVFRSEYDSKYTIGFSSDPNIYLYDKVLNSVFIYGGRSAFQHGAVNPLSKRYKNDSNKKLKHLTLSPIYKEILYDKYRDVYYRFLLNGIDEQNEDGTFNGWHDKEFILMIFDKKMRLIKEINLGKDKYNSTKSFVSSQGLFLYNYARKNNSESKNFEFDVLQIY